MKTKEMEKVASEKYDILGHNVESFFHWSDKDIWCDGYVTAMDEYASQFQQEWIPVEVRLPEITMQTSSNWVLTFDKSITRIDKAFYSTVTGWQAEHGEPMNVSHWMPLPTLPEVNA